VGDEQDAPRLGAEQGDRPFLQLRPRDRVQRRERLVQQQHRARGQQRPGERDPLAHAARQLVRARGRELLQAEAVEEFPRAAARFAAANAPQFERKPGIVERRAPGQQQISLRHQCAPRKPVGRGGSPFDGHHAGGRGLQPRHDLEQGRLAAA
jgi:hypothetical protein